MNPKFLLLTFVMAVVFFFGALSSNLRQEKAAGGNVDAPQLKTGPWLFWGAVAGVTFIACISALFFGLIFWERWKAITLGLVFAFGGAALGGWLGHRFPRNERLSTLNRIAQAVTILGAMVLWGPLLI